MVKQQSSATRPAIVVIPGSFSPSSLYSIVVEKLISYGYEATAIDLPSVGRHEDRPAATMADDAAHIQSVTSKLADEGKGVVLFMHSYGGIPGTESVKGFGKADREAQGKTGGVCRLVYCTSLVPHVGRSAKAMMGGSLPDSVHVDGDYLSLDPTLTAAAALTDLPPAEGLAWAEKMREHSAPSLDGELTYPAYKYISVTWLLCEKDMLFPPEYQRGMIDMITKESGRKVDVQVIAGGHCPNLSVPEAVVDVIRKAAEEMF